RRARQRRDHRRLRLGAVPAGQARGGTGRVAARVRAAEGRGDRRAHRRGAVGDGAARRGARVLRARPGAGSGQPFIAARAGRDHGPVPGRRRRMSAPHAAHGLLLAATLLLLGGCASHSARKAPPVAAEVEMATQQAREAVLLADPDWSLAGRVALANGSRGGSGRLEWRQAADHYSVALSAPITRQSWRLTVNPGGATIEGLDGGPRH